jgi:hypothetical protein
MIDAVRFITRYPEMKAINAQNPGYINMVIAEADLTVSSGVDDRDSLVMMIAAEKIASSPQGRAAQLVSKGKSTYTIALEAEMASRAAALRFF